jgi:hypothetical protein
VAEPKGIITDPDNVEEGKVVWTIATKPFDEGKNVRLIVHLNLSVAQPFFEIIQPDNMPPLAIAVVRADMRPVALGILEELKMKLFRLGAKMDKVDIKSRLAAGIGATVPEFLKRGRA